MKETIFFSSYHHIENYIIPITMNNQIPPIKIDTLAEIAIIGIRSKLRICNSVRHGPIILVIS